MNIIKKIIIFIKNIFTKQEDVKKLEQGRIITPQDNKINFINSLKINTLEEKTKKKVKTLICYGDGLGIQKKISY